jgi:hypothetical protein
VGCRTYVAVDARTVCVGRNRVRFVDHLIMVLVNLLFVVGDVDSDGVHHGGLGKGQIASIGRS